MYYCVFQSIRPQFEPRWASAPLLCDVFQAASESWKQAPSARPTALRYRTEKLKSLF